MKEVKTVYTFEEVYRQYFSDIYKYMLALTGNDLLASEITQETFFKALLSLGSFRGDCDIRLWLLKIAKNRWYSYLRREKHTVGEPDETLPSDDDVAARAEDRDDVRRIRQALQKTGEPYREVFTLRVLSELPFREIGELFGKTEHWACVTYHRAKEKIRKQMEEER